MAGAVPLGLGLYLALIQLLFTLGWTAYAIYLPQLAGEVGIPRTAVIFILMLDQAIFTLTDFAMGVAADRVAAVVGRLGHWVAGITVVSCLAFLAIPWIAGGGPAAQPYFLALTLVWAVTSSALRAPPLMLLGRYAARPSIPWLASLALLGYGVAGALAPYLSVMLRHLDPRWPFALSSLTLLLTALGLATVERATARQAAAAAPAPERRPVATAEPGFAPRIAVFTAAMVVLALGFQLHVGINSAPLFLRLATPADLDALLPVFWIGFNIAMLPASLFTSRYGGLPVMGIAALLGALAVLVAEFAGRLDVAVMAQFAAGAAWGAILMSAVAAALALGDTGAEGRATGLMFSALAVATFLRMAAVAVGLAADAAAAALLHWAPIVAWAAAGLALVALGMRRLAPPATTFATGKT